MFEGSDYPAVLDNEKVKEWLSEAVSLDNKYLLIIWDDVELSYFPAYIRDKEMLLEAYEGYDVNEDSGQAIVKCIDLDSGEDYNP